MLVQDAPEGRPRALTLADQEVEVNVGVEPDSGARLVFPSIGRLLRDSEVKAAKIEAREPLGASFDSAGNELDRLLALYSEHSDSAAYLGKLSSLAMACGRLEQAQELARQAVALGPGDRNERYRLAVALLQGRRSNDARSHFAELAEKGHLPSCLRMTESALTGGEMAAARVWLERAAAIDATDWRVQMTSGLISLTVGQYALAIRHFRNALEERPRSARLHYALGLAQVMGGGFSHASQAFRKASALAPFEQGTLVAWADLSVHSHCGTEDVREALQRYLKAFPTDRAINNWLAYILHDQGDIRGAQKLLKAVPDGDDDPVICNNLGVLAAERKQLASAAKQFMKAVVLLDQEEDGEEVSRLRTVSLANLVSALIDSSSFDEAAEVARHYTESVTLQDLLTDEAGSRIADGLVESLFSLSRFREAVDFAELWIDMPEVSPRLEASLAEKLVCYFSLEDVNYDRAYRYAKRAYSLQGQSRPRDPVRWHLTLNNLAYACIENAQYEEAAAFLSQLQPVPEINTAFGYATRGLLAIRKGQVEKGELLYKRSISIAASESKPQLRKKLYWELACYWEAGDDRKQMRKYLERMLRVRTTGMWKLGHLDRAARELLGAD